MTLDGDLDWQVLNREMEERDSKKKEAMWAALEHDGVVPEDAVLEGLSGLLGEDIERVASFWHELDLGLRREVIETLTQMAEADFTMDFSAVFRIAMKDDDPEVRAFAVSGLHEVEDVRLVSEYVDMLRHDPDPFVRKAAAKALANYVLLGELQKIRPEPFHAAVEALIEAYTDRGEKREVQRQAVESMAYTGTHQVPEMIALAYKQEEPEMRGSAVFAMGRSADERWAPIVQHELHNPNPEIRFEATRACGELQLREAVEEIVELTDDVNQAIREMALWALGQIGGNLARRTLERYAESDQDAMRDAAQEALQELEFFYGDLSTFFGPPETYDGESEDAWEMPDWNLDDELDEEDDALPGNDDDDVEAETWL
ncbi:MAG: HEAT repeat domain-containing protein [Anaerolineae bacterium]